MTSAEVEGSQPNWGASLSGKLHSRLPFPDAFDGGFYGYYSQSGEREQTSARPSGRRHFLGSFHSSSSQREPALYWDDINTPGIASYFNREGNRSIVRSEHLNQSFRRHVKNVEPPSQVQKAEGRRFLEQPVPSASRPSRRREMPEPNYSSVLARPTGRRCFRGSTAPLPSVTPATASAFGTMSSSSQPRSAGGIGNESRSLKKTATVPRPGVFAGRSSKQELIRVEDTDRYFLTYCDNPNFKRFLRTLKPTRRNPIERRKELKILKNMSEKQKEVDLVKGLDSIVMGDENIQVEG